MNYKLIAIDMDDTLLTHDKKISKGNLEALTKAYQKGICIVISTGRIYSSAYAYANMIGFPIYIIACNGALIRDPDDRTIYVNVLNYASMENIINVCNKYNTYFRFYTDSTAYSPEISNKFQKYAELNELFESELKVKIKEIKNPLQTIKELGNTVLKFTITDEDRDTIKKIKKELSQDYTLQITSSYFDNIEITNSGVSKGRALEILGGYLGIDRDEMIAIGDSENDLEMIEFAGFGVAMENAIDELKKVANFVTKSNMDDGVKHVIDKFLLCNKG